MQFVLLQSLGKYHVFVWLFNGGFHHTHTYPEHCHLSAKNIIIYSSYMFHTALLHC